ncbi:hypothetical protein Gotur_031825 [Gossypium turneri]
MLYKKSAVHFILVLLLSFLYSCLHLQQQTLT